MAKTGGAVQKLQDKAQRNAARFKMGSFKPVISRTKTPFAEKQVVYEQFASAIAAGFNPGPAECFRGDGLPDDSLSAIKAPKTNQERADADKRQPLKGEMVEGWRPRAFGKRNRSGCYLRK